MIFGRLDERTELRLRPRRSRRRQHHAQRTPHRRQRPRPAPNSSRTLPAEPIPNTPTPILCRARHSEAGRSQRERQSPDWPAFSPANSLPPPSCGTLSLLHPALGPARSQTSAGLLTRYESESLPFLPAAGLGTRMGAGDAQFKFWSWMACPSWMLHAAPAGSLPLFIT